ncbi:MAG: hypothetical protein CMM66_03400 [Rhodospirillaceae bacterium]|nr:hypothetical protein [Rhodospirillaceae bacterium]
MDNFIYRIDRPGTGPLRAATRHDHLDFATSLGRWLKYAGPTLATDEKTMIGSVWVLQADSLEDADRLTALDPYKKIGLFASKIIHPILQVVLSDMETRPEDAQG